MTNVLITKSTFSRVKKSLKTSLLDKFGLDAKLSEVSQVLATALGFADEHELQKHFEKEVPPSSVSTQSTTVPVQDQFIAFDIVVDSDAYFNARSSHPCSIRLDSPLLSGNVHVIYNINAEGTLNRSDSSRRTVYAKASDLVGAANASRHGDTHHIEIFWQKPGVESTLTKIEKVIASHFASKPPTAIQKLSFDYADYGLDLFLMALNKEKTDIEGFGFYYSDDITKYKEKELSRLSLSQSDKELIDKLLTVSGLTQNKIDKERTSLELKYEIAQRLGLEGMNANMQDERNYFEYDLYQNKELSGVISIYPHGLFQGKMKQINVNPNKVLSSKLYQANQKQLIEYVEQEHAEEAVVMKIPIYTSYYKTNKLQYIPVAWVQNWMRKTKEVVSIGTTLL